MRWVLERGAVVICAGGGGIPTMYARGEDRRLVGVEAVIDKDLASSLLARDLEADLYVMATDVDAVYRDWGTPEQTRLDHVTPEELAAMQFPAGSMGPKVDAAARVRGGHRQAGRDRLARTDRWTGRGDRRDERRPGRLART